MDRRLNLLPVERRLGLRQETLLSAVNRFLYRVVICLGVLGVLGILAGVGMWVASLLVGQTAESELARQVAVYHRLKSEIDNRNTMLELIEGRARGRKVWSDLMPDLLDAVPSGATISSLQVDEKDGTITFSGVAEARSSLVVFEERLRLLPWVVDMTAPRANLLSRVDTAYTFSLTVREEESLTGEGEYGDIPPEP